MKRRKRRSQGVAKCQSIQALLVGSGHILQGGRWNIKKQIIIFLVRKKQREFKVKTIYAYKNLRYISSLLFVFVILYNSKLHDTSYEKILQAAKIFAEPWRRKRRKSRRKSGGILGINPLFDPRGAPWSRGMTAQNVAPFILESGEMLFWHIIFCMQLILLRWYF